MNELDFLVLNSLYGFRHTANECIQKIKDNDFEEGIERNTHFYTHLNKKFAPLVRKSLVEHVGYKVGESGREEKVWALTLNAEIFILSQQTKNDPQQISA